MYLATAIVLGQAIAAGRVGYSPVALGLIAAAIGLGAAGVFWPAVDPPGGAAASRVVVAVGVVAAFGRVPLVDLYWRFPVGRPRLAPFVGLGGVSAALAACVVLRRPRAVGPACLPVLLATAGLMGAFYLSLSPDPRIDVFNFHRDGCAALLAGRDPYAITIPDPYVPPSHFYRPGVEVGGRILCGYCYPPLTLLLTVPAYLLGDPRWADVAAYILAAAVIAYGFRRRREDPYRGTGPAVLLLFAPGVFTLYAGCWTEPMVVLLLATTAALAARGWVRSAAVSAGLLLASKQYVPLAAPAVVLLVPRPWWTGAAPRWAGLALAAGLVVTLPFVLWNPQAFVHSQTVLNAGVIRADSISFLPSLIRATGIHPPLLACPVVAAVAAGAAVAWQAPRTPAGFAAAMGLTLTCVFALSPLAFGNYYALAVGAFLVAAAAER